ncbi:MAG TPA: hypothetical protein VNH63_06655 [Gemmatimonadales bacterium]|nr:hypothetical protein [Gemmatimonadales bacterium]
MKGIRLVLPVLLVCALGLTLSCGDSAPTSVAVGPKPQADLIGGLLGATGLLSCSDLPYASTTQVIGPEGGTMSAGPHSFVIPAGALSQPTTITMIQPTGDHINAVQFKPAGLQFAKPAYLTMSYANCSLLGKILPKHIAYVDDNLNILYYLLSLDNLFAKKVTGQVNHFSEYAMAW